MTTGSHSEGNLTSNSRLSVLRQRFDDPSKQFGRAHAEALFNIISDLTERLEISQEACAKVVKERNELRDAAYSAELKQLAHEPPACPHCETWQKTLVVTEAERKRLELRCDELEDRCAEPPKVADEDVADARRWIAYLESQPQHEPDVSIAKVLRDLVQFYEWALPQFAQPAEPPETALDDHSELLKKLPNVHPDLVAELEKLSKWALVRRVLIQADGLGSYSKCLDGLDLRVGVDGCWNPRDIRAAVEKLRAAEPPSDPREERLREAFLKCRQMLATQTGTFYNAAHFGLTPEDIGMERASVTKEESP